MANEKTFLILILIVLGLALVYLANNYASGALGINQQTVFTTAAKQYKLIMASNPSSIPAQYLQAQH